jgi:Na+/melibiose symporter-like transporter
VAGLTAAAIGTVFLVVRLRDAFTDLFAGRMVDETMTRFGKFPSRSSSGSRCRFCVMDGFG